MVITSKLLADMLMKYINREITLKELIDWAEEGIKEADFEPEKFEIIRDILARIGLSDVREFGLTWDDCYDYLHKLGYNIKVELVKT